jgi:hypothetical protein
LHATFQKTMGSACNYTLAAVYHHTEKLRQVRRISGWNFTIFQRARSMALCSL